MSSVDEEGGVQAILAAIDSGVRLIDTASLYVTARQSASSVSIHDPSAHVFDRVMGPDGALAELRKLKSEGVVGHVGIASNNPWDNAPYIETGEFEATVIPDAYSLISNVAVERMFPAA